MKILFLTPPYKKDKIFRKSMKHLGAVLPPLGIAYVAAVLERDDHEVRIIDATAESTVLDYNFDKLRKDIEDFQPDVVGVSGNIPQLENVQETLKIVKEINPKTITIIGGPIVSSDINFLKKLPNADYGVLGEADLAISEIFKKLEKKEKIEGSEGLIWREQNTVKSIKPRDIFDLDVIPMPARHLLKMHIYRPSPANYRRLPASTIMTSRGCPYKCTFCSRSIEGMAWRAHSAERVVDEFEELATKYGIKDVQIFDDTFTLHIKRIEDICKGLIERNIDIGWNCMTRVDRVTVDLFKLMKKAGCYEVGFGIESGSDRILKFIKKSATTDQIRHGVNLAKKAGIDVRGFFMLGFPTETKNEIMQTINFAKELNVDVAQFMIATPYPGTEMWNIAKENGRINDEDYSNFTFYAPDKMPFSSENFTDQELVNLYRKAYRSYYLRPKFIIKQLLKVRSLQDINRNWLAAKGITGF